MASVLEEPNAPWTKNLTRLHEINFTEDVILTYNQDSNSKKSVNLGYRMFKAHKTSNVFIANDGNKIFVKANVQASFTLSKKYLCKILIYVHLKVEIVKASCGCPAGLSGACKHIYTLLWSVFDIAKTHASNLTEVACTSLPRKWGIGAKSRTPRSATKFAELNFIKHDVKRKAKNTERLILQRRKNLADIQLTVRIDKKYIEILKKGLADNGIGEMFQDVLQENHLKQNSPLPSLFPKEAELLPSDDVNHEAIQVPILDLWKNEVGEIIGRNNYNVKLLECCQINLSQAQDLFKNTTTQSVSERWKKERSKRITASNFYEIIRRKASVTNAFVNKIFKCTEIRQTADMALGLANEERALEKYKISKNLVGEEISKVFDVGLVVNPGCPFLGATPDKLVQFTSGNNVLIEIKTLTKAMKLELSVCNRKY
ncbi:uncharacterized protein LOC116174268 [Photinus pyralis]|uniref:uncharacterized protein LOC116174268 n=1 Tax=Photinus pyralis TaxID=7054 RepID=UPI0012676FF4|nr:uncharacterized protein LOC116174268 [Photinus pyralis]